MIDRRRLLRSGLLGLAGGSFLLGSRRSGAVGHPAGHSAGDPAGHPAGDPRVPGVSGVSGAPLETPEPASRSAGPRPPVVSPDSTTLPSRWEDGVKVFHLVAEPVQREFAPGLTVNCWGYNGHAPGPLIEAIEGERVRILVTNKLPEATSIHWHGVLVPNGMDGISGLNQPMIAPGETFQYEFTLHQHGTQMYHPHFDEMTQIGKGMMGFFVIHPRDAALGRVDRDFAIFLHEWAIQPGTAAPDPTVMTDFNVFTFNGRVYPGTSPLVVRRGQRVRLRLANLSMDSHPIHVHGVSFRVTGTDGGRVPESAQYPETTVNVAPGATRDIEFVANVAGDWAVHCHKTHHTMNQMAHGLPLMLGVDTSGTDEKVQKLLPQYMAMGRNGMGDMMKMGAPRNSIPMLGGEGPSGAIDMGGMFTILKVRDGIVGYEDPGWYSYPPGTQAHAVKVKGS